MKMNHSSADPWVMEGETILEEMDSILSAHESHRKNLIPILQATQQHHGYLSQHAMEMVADHLHISPSEVYGVASFYNQFRFHPPGKHRIKVCLGTACHVVGGDIILENFERKLGIKDGETTPDREFSIERVACVGCCALAPVALVDDTVEAHIAPSRVEGILLGFELQKEQQEKEAQESESSS